MSDATRTGEQDSGLREVLRQSEASFRAWFDRAGVGIAYIETPTGRFIRANHEYCELVGYSAEEMGRTDFQSITHPDDLAPDLAQMRRLVAGEVSEFTLEKRYLHKDGHLVWVTLTVTPLWAPGAQPDFHLAIVQDITARKEAEANRKAVEQQLAHSQKMQSLGKLAGGVAHDINNVLAAILGIASTPRPGADAEVREAFDTISTACERGGDLVKGLLAFSRERPAQEVALDLNALVREQVQLLQPTTLARVQVALELDEALHPVLGDPGALSHALMNLSVNAVDAMPDGGVLTLRTRQEPQAVLLEVEDTGQGMPPEVLARAVDPFFTTKPPGQGTGLGLAIAFSTAQAHGGHLALSSAPGKGTLASMRFPMAKGALPTARKPARPVAVPLAGNPRVLLVDDDRLVRRTLQLVLEDLGCDVTAVESGEDALTALEAGGFVPQVVVLDVHMPGLGGVGTLPKLRTLLPEVPVLLSSGKSDQEVLELSEAWGNLSLLAKPFTSAALREALAAALGEGAG